MITIKAIVGEAFDLDTGTSHGRGLLISNGTTNKVISVSDAVIQDIVELFSENAKAKQVTITTQPVARVTPTYDDVAKPDPNTLFVEKNDVAVEKLTGVGSI